MLEIACFREFSFWLVDNRCASNVMCLLVLNHSMHPSSLLPPLSPSPFTSPLPSFSLSIHHPMCRFLSFDSVSRVYHWVLSSGATNGRGVDEFLLCTAVCLYVMSWRSLCFCLYLNLLRASSLSSMLQAILETLKVSLMLQQVPPVTQLSRKNSTLEVLAPAAVRN